MTADFDRPRMKIAAVQGASCETIQCLLADFSAKRARDGVRVSGAIEIAEPAGTGTCGERALRDLWTGDRIPIS